MARAALHDGKVEAVLERAAGLVLFFPALIESSGKPGFKVARRIRGLAAADDMKPQGVLGARERFKEDVAQALADIDVFRVGGLKGETVQAKELDEMPVFGEDGLVIVMAGIGDEVPRRDLGAGQARFGGSMFFQLDHWKGS